MRTIFETCTPREDVLSGHLQESQFAADLYAVANRLPDVPAIYRDPRTFFAYTYPTRGLQELVRQALGRFSGSEGGSPAIRLETSMGGGKTHNLIALWHLAKASSDAAVAADGWLPRDALSIASPDPVALVGDHYGASEVAAHDGILARTLWGEMAWQLGRYDVMRDVDEQRLAPSEGRLQQLLAGRRVLVLLDELARYLRGAKGQRVGGGTLADQTLVFFHLLLTYAASHNDLVVVYTLTGVEDAYGVERDEIIEQIGEARAISARQERVMTPVAEDEVAHVLRRRLFEEVDMEAAEEVARAYVDHLLRIRQQGAPVPAEVGDPTFLQRIQAAYPFHPELLETLYRKTSSFPTFQRTRGALRLLAATVRRLWQERPPDAYLFHSTDIDLSNPIVREELTSRLDRPRLATAVAEDIWSDQGNAHAQELDRDWAAKGAPHLSQRVAQAVFLHSLVHGVKPGVAGAEPAEVHLACARPGLPFDLVDKALAQIDATFWYADFDGRRYLFHDEPTIKKLIAQATAGVGIIAAKDAIRLKLRELYGGAVFRLVPFPPGAEAVPDEAGKPLLVLLDFDHVAVEAGSAATPPVVEEIFQRAGENRDFRHYQNNLIVLAADISKKQAMIDAARKATAIEGLLTSQELRQKLHPEDRKKLEQAKGTAALEYRVALTNGHSHLFYRSLYDGRIAHHELLPQDSADAQRPMHDVLRSVLEAQNKVLTKDLVPEWVLDRIWTEGASGEAQISLEDLVDRFARRPRAYLLLDEGLRRLRQTIRQGVEQEAWVYVDRETSRVYRKDRPPSAEQVRFAGSAILMTLALASRLHPVEAPVPVPPTPPGPGPLPPPRPGPGPAPIRPPVVDDWAEAEGPAPRAFTEAMDKLRERGRDAVEELRIDVVGLGNIRALLAAWSAVANAFEGASVAIDHDLEAQAGGREPLSLQFRGPALLFARLHGWLRPVLEGATQEAHSVVRVHARFGPPWPLSDGRLTQLARDLDETYGCRPVGVRAR